VSVRESSYASSTVAPFKDSQPIAGDLLVERLEEISTQRDSIEDPERSDANFCHLQGSLHEKKKNYVARHDWKKFCCRATEFSFIV
jgi:hypothetical protein